MKKIVVGFVFLMIAVVQSYSQRTGDLYFGLESGYIPSYKGFLFGTRASYSITDPFELNFTYLMNPIIKSEEPDGTDSKTKIHSLSLDAHYYILLQRTWSMGPALGGQYFYRNISYEKVSYSGTSYGLNMGWHMRYNFTENLVARGGWRYTPATNDNSHHLFYLGVGYCFNLY